MKAIITNNYESIIIVNRWKISPASINDINYKCQWKLSPASINGIDYDCQLMRPINTINVWNWSLI